MMNHMAECSVVLCACCLAMVSSPGPWDPSRRCDTIGFLQVVLESPESP